jgi:Putative zinc-finger
MLEHDQMTDQDLIERYVRRQLDAEESAAFEEHLFQCDECFDRVQLTEKFLAGVRHAGRNGWLDQPRETMQWLFPAFGLAAAGLLVAIVALSWLLLIRTPARDALLARTLATVQAQQQRLTEMDRRVALDLRTEANVPVAILTAERGAGGENLLSVLPESRNAILWIDMPQQRPGTSFRADISSASGKYKKSLEGLKPNATSALAASVPVDDLPDGRYTVRVTKEGSSAILVGEYRLRVSRH